MRTWLRFDVRGMILIRKHTTLSRFQRNSRRCWYLPVLLQIEANSRACQARANASRAVWIDHQVGEGEQGLKYARCSGGASGGAASWTEQSLPRRWSSVSEAWRDGGGSGKLWLLAGGLRRSRRGRPVFHRNPRYPSLPPEAVRREGGRVGQRDERLTDATTPPQAATGECRLMHLRLHANATAMSAPALNQKSRASNAELGEHSIITALWRAGARRMSPMAKKTAHIASTPA